MKSPYRDRAEAQMEMLKAKLGELRAKMKSTNASTRIKLQQKIKELEAKMY